MYPMFTPSLVLTNRVVGVAISYQVGAETNRCTSVPHFGRHAQHRVAFTVGDVASQHLPAGAPRSTVSRTSFALAERKGATVGATTPSDLADLG
jgi:hypothetical protein